MRRPQSHFPEGRWPRQRLRTLLLSGVLLAAPVSAPRADEVAAEARRATRLYGAGDYEAAAAAFENARELAAAKGQSPPTLDYNLGTTLAKLGAFEQAVSALKRSSEFPDPKGPPDLRERTFYNLGVSEARIAERLRTGGEGQRQAEAESLRLAMDAFRQTLILDPANEDARHNYALAKRRLDVIEAMKQEAPPPQHKGGQASPQHGSTQEQEGASNRMPPPLGPPQGSGAPGEKSQPEPQSASGPSAQGGSPAPDGALPSGQTSPPERQQSGSGAGDTDTFGEPDARPSEKGGAGGQDAGSSGRQRGGLEAAPSPTPAAAPGSGRDGAGVPQTMPEAFPPETEEGAASAEGIAGPPSGAIDGAATGIELTPEQINARRVLNALEEGSPDQFKRLFQFRGRGGRDLERDW